MLYMLTSCTLTLPHHNELTTNIQLVKVNKPICGILCFVDRASLDNLLLIEPTWCTDFLIRLLLFSTCLWQLCAHHQEKIL